MTRTATMRKQHDAIVELAGEIAAGIESLNTPLDAERLMRTLNRLNGLLTAHLASEDTFLYPAMRASADQRTAETAAAFGQEMGGLMAAYSQFTARWADGPSIFANKAEFACDWRALLKRLAGRIERENLVLYPLADAMDDARVQRRA